MAHSSQQGNPVTGHQQPPGNPTGPWQRAVTADPLAAITGKAHPLAGLTLTAAYQLVADATPDDFAVIDATHSLTHTQIVAAVCQVASALRQLIDTTEINLLTAPSTASAPHSDPVARGPVGVVHLDPSDTPVGTPTYVLCDHDATAIVAIMAVAAAGATHLVLDHRAPAAHRAAIVAQHGAGPVVCAPNHLNEARLLASSPEAVVVADARSQLNSDSGTGTGVTTTTPVYDDTRVDDHAPLMVSSTSGTSGVPKAVVHSHRTVVANAVRFAAATNLGPRDRIVVSLPFAFVASGTPTYAALLSGATAVVVDPSHGGAAGIAAGAAAHGATVVFLTAALVDSLGRHDPSPVPTVRLVVTGGDQLGTDSLQIVARWFPNASLLHRYNTSESLWATGLVTDPARELPAGAVPIGWPVPWLDAEVTDNGELVVTGDHLALGYLNDPELTAGRFTKSGDGRRRYHTGDLVEMGDEDCLWHRGRLDTTVKVAGTLVDPMAVEQAFVGLDGVNAAAVVAVTDAEGNTRLAAWVVAPGFTLRMVRRAITDRLPSAMLPPTVTLTDTLPLTAMGKVDRAALAASAEPVVLGSGGPPCNETEQLVAETMGAVLALPDMGRLDDVFSLGADSLDVLEICARLTSVMHHRSAGRTIDVPDLIDNPTPADLAAWLLGLHPSAPEVHHPRLRRLAIGDQTLPPVVLFAGGGGGHVLGMTQLARAIGTGEVWGVLPRGFATRSFPDRTIEAQAATVVADISERWPDRPVSLVSYSAGGVVAAEVARQLLAKHRPPVAVVLINCLLLSDAERQHRSAREFRKRLAQKLINEGRSITLLHRALWLIDPLRRKLRERWKRYSAGIVARQGKPQRRVFASISWAAALRHRPGPLPCDVTLIRASIDTDGFARAPHDLNWADIVTGRLRIVTIPGQHHELVTSQMPRTAAAVAEALTYTPHAAVGLAMPPPRRLGIRTPLACPDVEQGDRGSLPEMTAMFTHGWPDDHGIDEPEDTTIAKAFTGAASADTARVAVCTPTASVTYAELDVLSRSVTTALAACPPSPRPVLVLADHGADAVAAVLGIVGSGRIALLLDPLDPAEALVATARRFGGGPVVVDDAHVAMGRRVAGNGRLVVIGATKAPVEVAPADVEPADPATVSSTSGTTSTPKAVVHSHRNVVANAARYRAAIGADTSDVFVVVGPLAAQSSATPVFSALLGGATLGTYDLRRRGPSGLPGFINDIGGTVVHLPPSAIDALPSIAMPSVRLVSLGGDRVTAGQLAQARALFANATLLHRYSTSETNWIAGWALDPDDLVPTHKPPAGQPVPWLDVRVVTSAGSDVGPGEVGNIVVAGNHLALGYLDDPNHTAERFGGTGATRTFDTGDRGRWLPDGSLEVVGRADNARNLRGTIVELGLVEAALEQLNGVDAAAATTDDKDRIVAFVTGSGVDGRHLRAALARRLPAPAVPARVLILDALPLTSRGKVDRDALAIVAADRLTTGTEPPRDDTEQRVAAIFADALDIGVIGRCDDVFDLGADSLTTVEILTALTTEFATAVPLSVLLEHPTASDMAHWLRRPTHMAPSPAGDQRTVYRLTTGPKDRVPVVIFTGGGGGHLAGAAILAHRLSARTSYAVVPRSFQRGGRPDRTLGAMGRRAAAELVGLGHDQLVLVGHSSGGSLAIETARQMEGSGIKVPLVVLLDTLAMTPEVLHARRLDRWLRWSIANDRRRRDSQRWVASLMADGRVVAGFGYRRISQWWLATTAGIVMRNGRRQHDAFAALTRQALRRQPTTPYTGDVVLVRAAENPWSHLPDDLRWSTVALGTMTVVHAGGTHNGMLTEPQVTDVAALIDEALARIR